MHSRKGVVFRSKQMLSKLDIAVVGGDENQIMMCVRELPCKLWCLWTIVLKNDILYVHCSYLVQAENAFCVQRLQCTGIGHLNGTLHVRRLNLLREIISNDAQSE